jgi:hypothetical protein
VPSLAQQTMVRPSYQITTVSINWLSALKRVAENNGLLNPHGDPNINSFATFAYCAKMHVDNDDAPSCGWVTKRNIKVCSAINLFLFSAEIFSL